MFLNPVRTSITSTPYSLHSGSTILDVTIDFTNTGFSGSLFCLARFSITYWTNTAPAWLPFRETTSPLWITSTARRSQSGSVAMITSALTSLANLSPYSNAAVSSGFGYSIVGNVPSGSFCSSTTWTFLNPRRARTVVTALYPAPLSGVYTTEISLSMFSSLIAQFRDSL